MLIYSTLGLIPIPNSVLFVEMYKHIPTFKKIKTQER